MFSNSFLSSLIKIYDWLISITSHFQSIFIFLLRITWGYQFWLAGKSKLLNVEKVTIFFQNLGLIAPKFTTYMVGSLELIGGACLIIGLASRLVSIPLTLIMFAAYSTAHSHVFADFSFVSNPTLLVLEQPFAFLITSLVVLLFGPGRFSIDGWIKWKVEKKKKYF